MSFAKNITSTSNFSDTEELKYQLSEAKHHLDQVYSLFSELNRHLVKYKNHVALAEIEMKKLDQEAM